MRLVVATPLYPPESGGPATYAKLLAEGLPANGVEIEIVKFSDVRRFPKLLRHYVYYKRVKKALKSADAVLALDPVSTGLPALKASKKLNKPFFVKIVGDYAWEQGTQRFGVTDSLDDFVVTKKVPFPVALLRKVQEKVARGAVRVLVPSHYLKSVIHAWGIDQEKIEVIYNSIALEEGGTVPKEVSALAHPRIVTIGRLVPWKNMKGVIDAVSKIKNATLTIVGDGPERGALEGHAKGILPNTVFTGALTHSDTLAVLKDADVFVLNSTYEGLSHLLIEALSLGIPTVATRAGGNTELLKDEPQGTLVPVNDTEALAEGIRVALTKSKDTSGGFAARFAPATMLQKTAALISSHV
jgi:glycosyltransferase involved in cell wall biosynthesis